MFKKIKEHFEGRQRVKGLSKGLEIVDECLRPGLNSRALDRAAGEAHARIHMLYINGEITENERGAALCTLHNHHDKLYHQAKMAETFA